MIFRSLRRGLCRAVALGVVAWLVGLGFFVARIEGAETPTDDRTDGVVVLTGGAQRIARGIELLRDGQAERLFVSGVRPGTIPPELQRFRVDRPDLWSCCVAVGAAENTEDNARETAQWAAANAIRTLRVVTADYHLARALLEFHRSFPPDVTLVGDPVHPSVGNGTGLRHWMLAGRLIVTEYNKYLLASLRAFLQPRASGIDPDATPPETP